MPTWTLWDRTTGCRTVCSRDSDNKGTLLGTPNREPQEYSRNEIGICLPISLYSSIFLQYSWGSLFGVPSKVPLDKSAGIHFAGLPGVYSDAYKSVCSCAADSRPLPGQGWHNVRWILKSLHDPKYTIYWEVWCYSILRSCRIFSINSRRF